jgi:hypothetical protein
VHEELPRHVRLTEPAAVSPRSSPRA